MLQPFCKPEPVQNSIRLQCYFNGARELVLQGEPYYSEGEVSTVSAKNKEGCWFVCPCVCLSLRRVSSSCQLSK